MGGFEDCCRSKLMRLAEIRVVVANPVALPRNGEFPKDFAPERRLVPWNCGRYLELSAAAAWAKTRVERGWAAIADSMCKASTLPSCQKKE